MVQKSPNTVSSYISHLNKMNSAGIVRFFDTQKVIDYFDSRNLSLNSRRAYISAVIYHIKQTKTKTKDKLVEKYGQILKDYNKQQEEVHDKSELTEREKENYMEWNDIVDVYKNFKNIGSKDHLILSLYVKTPPRRLDYWSITYEIDTTKDLDQSKNYYVRIPGCCCGFFMFFEYKTKYAYGKQIITIPQDLDDIIFKYMQNNDIKVGQQIFNVTKANTFGKYIGNIFYNECGKRITANILRHSYISNFIHNEKPTSGQIKRTSKMMAHSIEQQMKYIKKVDNKVTKQFDTNEAIRVRGRYIGGRDMSVTLYFDIDDKNSQIINNFKEDMGDESVEIDKVSHSFAIEHPKYFECTGVFDVEICEYIQGRIKCIRKAPNENIDTWLGDSPKFIDWKKFFARSAPVCK
jgi:hypothetical protein